MTQSALMRSQGLRRERTVASPHFRDGSFCNTAAVGAGLKGNPLPILGEFFFGDSSTRLPSGPLPLLDPRPIWQNAPDSGMRATWLGHSTVLLEMDGRRVLTDPVWGQRASFTAWAGPKRFAPVPVSLSDLPALDAVVISHNHYDHLDYPTVCALAKTSVPFYTSLGVGATLEAWGVAPERITELDWWESATLCGGDLQITAAPAQHFSGRGLRDRNHTFWSSFVVRSTHHAAFFSGDTGLTQEYSAISTRLGPLDLVMLEIGAWHPAWGDIHLGPEAALKAFAMLRAGSPNAAFLPVHWGTFNLALHAWDEPAETLVRLASQDETVRLLMPPLGGTLEPARAPAVEPWWRTVLPRRRFLSGWRAQQS